MIKTTLLFLFSACAILCHAQIQWINPMQNSEPVIQGQAFSEEIGKTYTRLPLRAKETADQGLFYLSHQSAGLAIHFYTDAPEVKVRYRVTGAYAMPHMPSTGVSGLDLYSIDSHGKWRREIANGYAFDSICSYNYTSLSKSSFHQEGNQYRLFLPLYNGVEWLEIGIPEANKLTFIPQRKEKPIVVYGTSIAQGACASRPGMAWTNILTRQIDKPLINLGFSGNGKLEPEVLSFIGEIDACVYVLDCLPNIYTKEFLPQLSSLIRNAVNQLREKSTAPILLVEHASGNFDQGLYGTLEANKIARMTFDSLQTEGFNNLFYMSSQACGLSEDGLVDCIHPSDYGMQQVAEGYEQKLREILNEPKGTLTTTQPVSQRREAGGYEWLKRHQEILTLNAEMPPKSVIMGNSITHFWGGMPQAHIAHGPISWKKYMDKAGFRNMGFGWDRVENLLWRVYNGELDGYDAEHVVIKIGTNNLELNTNEEIVSGIAFLLDAVRTRQPKAKISILGLLPRRGLEDRIIAINKMIATMSTRKGYKYTDVGGGLLLPSGKINETMFMDGLHPNEAGYKVISERLFPTLTSHAVSRKKYVRNV